MIISIIKIIVQVESKTVACMLRGVYKFYKPSGATASDLRVYKIRRPHKACVRITIIYTDFSCDQQVFIMQL